MISKFKIKHSVFCEILLTVTLVIPGWAIPYCGSFKNHLENYNSSSSSNAFSTAQQAEFEDFWTCVFNGKLNQILERLHSHVQNGYIDEYFMALNYLLYLHDYCFKSPQLLEMIERIIDQSVEDNIIHSSALSGNSATFNILKYLILRFKPQCADLVDRVPYTVIDYQTPNSAIIEKLIDVLGPNDNTESYNLITNYLRTLPPLIYNQVNFEQPARNCLQQILALLNGGTYCLSPALQQAVCHYYNLFNNEQLDYTAWQADAKFAEELMSYVPNFNSPHRQVLLEFLNNGKLVRELVKPDRHPLASRTYLIHLLQKGLTFSDISNYVKEAFSFYVNYFHSLNVLMQLGAKLPHFHNSPEKEWSNLLASFLASQQFETILSTYEMSEFNLDSVTLLQDVLTLLQNDAFVPENIKWAASFYLKYYDSIAVKEMYSLDELFNLIPQPRTSTEIVYYNCMRSLFGSTTFLEVIGNSHIQAEQDHEYLLREILNCILNYDQFDMEYKEAILHYLKVLYNEGLTTEQMQEIEILLQDLKSMPIDTHFYEQIATLLRSNLAYLVFRETYFDFTQNTSVLWEEILETIIRLSYLDYAIREAAVHCKAQVHKVFVFETQTIAQIHNAFLSLPSVIVENYKMELDIFLRSNEMYNIIHHSHFDMNRNINEILYEVFNLIQEDNNVSIRIREACYHYSKYIESLLGNIPCDFEGLLKLLPTPVNYWTQTYFDTLKMYLQNGVPRFLATKIDFNQKPSALLFEILQTLAYSDRIPVNIKEAARYYCQSFNSYTTTIDSNRLSNRLDQLTLILPKNRSILVAKYYNALVSYLKGNYLLSVLSMNDINLHQSNSELLRAILALTINDSNVCNEIRIAATSLYNMFNTAVIGQRIIENTEVYNRNQQEYNMENFYRAKQFRDMVTSVTNQMNQHYMKEANICNTTESNLSSSKISRPTTEGITRNAKSMTISSSILTAEQTALLQKMEVELKQLNITETYFHELEIIQQYLKTKLVYELLLTSCVDMTASSYSLLVDFIEIATHTNDIPRELRLACEQFKLLVPELKHSASISLYSQFPELHKIFHKIVVPTSEHKHNEIMICYNAIDSYLHSEVPSVVAQTEHNNFKRAPIELLQDFILVSKEHSFLAEDIEIIESRMQSSEEEVDDQALSHYYQLLKITHLLEIPQQQECLKYYYLIDNYFRSSTILELLKSNTVDFTQASREILKSILSLTIKADHPSISTDIREAAIYYHNLVFAPAIEELLEILFVLIPTPEEQGIQELYRVNEYLHSTAAMDVQQMINFDSYRQPMSLLINILDLCSHNGKVNLEVKHAAEFLLHRMTLNPIQPVILQSMVTRYCHTSVHSMKSLPSIAIGPSPSTYTFLLNLLPRSKTSIEGLIVIQEFFSQITSSSISTYLTSEEMTLLANNEEGLLRTILFKLVHDDKQAENLREACIQLIRHRYFDCNSFVSFLPSATFPEEEGYYTLMTQFLSGHEIYRYLDITSIEYQASLESLKSICSKFAVFEQVSIELRQAFSYYLNHAPFFDYSSLINLLPEATSTNIKKLYTTAVQFLSTAKLVNRCTQNIVVSEFADSDELLLKEVLQRAENSDWLEENIRVAAKYYLTVIKSVKSVKSVSVQKVLTKTLDLSSIFTDAFDFSSFSKIQFDAYHVFWDFVSERTQKFLAMPAFEFWTEENSRGSFTTKFLAVLSSTPDVPEDILNAISILKPLVQLENGGDLAV